MDEKTKITKKVSVIVDQEDYDYLKEMGFNFSKIVRTFVKKFVANFVAEEKKIEKLTLK